MLRGHLVEAFLQSEEMNKDYMNIQTYRACKYGELFRWNYLCFYKSNIIHSFTSLSKFKGNYHLCIFTVSWRTVWDSFLVGMHCIYLWLRKREMYLQYIHKWEMYFSQRLLHVFSIVYLKKTSWDLFSLSEKNFYKF